MKKTVTTKPNAQTLPTSDTEVEALIRTVIHAQIEQEKLIADRDAAMIAAASPYSPKITEHKATIDQGMDTLERWAAAHKERFADAKSVVIAGHRVGWRMGNWATKLKSKVTWANVLERLKDLVSIGTKPNASKIAADRANIAATFLRVKEEPNKEQMLNCRDNPFASELLADIGVGFTQDSAFYLCPDREGQSEPMLSR